MEILRNIFNLKGNNSFENLLEKALFLLSFVVLRFEKYNSKFF